MTDLMTAAAVTPGPVLPSLTQGPITRTQLALFAGASGDHNPIHLDDAEARAGGLPGVIVHGMLMMAILGRMLSDWAGQAKIREFRNRFVAMASPGDTVTCSGVVTGLRASAGETLADVEIMVENQNGAILLKGTATVVLQ